MSETVNKKLLGEAIATKLDISKKQANEFVDAFLEEVKSTLEKKGTVELAGFGKFEVRHRAARDGFNPATRETIRIQASYSVGFKPAKALKDAVKDLD